MFVRLHSVLNFISLSWLFLQKIDEKAQDGWMDIVYMDCHGEIGRRCYESVLEEKVGVGYAKRSIQIASSRLDMLIVLCAWRRVFM